MKPTLVWRHPGKMSQAALLREEGRFALEGAWLRPTEKPEVWQLCATESHIMVWITVQVENDEKLRERAEASDGAVFVPLEALQALERRQGLEAVFEPSGSITIGDITYHIPKAWGYTKREDGFPGQPSPIGTPEKFEPEQKETYRFGFDPALLSRIAKALGARHGLALTVDPTKNNIAIKVDDGYDGNGGAIIMPVRLNADS